jgi:hypothetical protein
MANPPYTLLAIDGIDFSDYAIRGITMTLEPIEQAKNVVRDCRGILVDISVSQFRQYKTTITCKDHEAPELTNIWPGQDITITCIPGIGVGNPLVILAKVTGWNTSREEWPAEVAWQLEAEQRSFT